MANSKQIVYLSKSQYAELVANGTITVNGVTVTYDENDIYVTPQAEPVTDVQINGTSVTANGVANIPMATATTAGVIIVGDGLQKGSTKLLTNPASAAQIKAGIKPYEPIVPSSQHISTFYGLAKAAGHDEKDSTESLGTYTPEAKGAIQKMLGVTDIIATEENDLIASKPYAIGDIFVANGKLYKATAAIAQDATIILPDDVGANCEEITVADGFPHDVQVNGTSVVQNGVANVPIASNTDYGVVKVQSYNGLEQNFTGYLQTAEASSAEIKSAASHFKPIVPVTQDKSVFYGLAKAAGDTTQSASSNAVGQYTPEAKEAIQSMLGIDEGMFIVPVSGTTVSITAQGNRRYICGEVTSISITPPESGICDVIFTSGTSVAVLTATGVTWPEWFDPEALETETTYELSIANGRGVVCSWPSA